MIRLLLPVLALSITACTGSSSPLTEPLQGEGDGSVRPADTDGSTGTPSSTPGSEPGAWERYSEAPADADWPVRPLDDERWVLVSAEFGCAGRSSQGDPEAHRRRVQNIAFHHKTTPRAVMDYGVRLNTGDSIRAQDLGLRVRDTLGHCP
jgi:hypothetical protein